MRRPTALLLTAALALPLAARGPEDKAVDTVRYGLSNAWDVLIPYNSPLGSNYPHIIHDKIYSRPACVHVDNTLEPCMVPSWESADGGTVTLFHLDEKTVFHDGTSVTMEHWMDTIALLISPVCSTLGWLVFAMLSGTDDTGAAVLREVLRTGVADKHTLKLTLKAPTMPEDLLLDKNREHRALPTHLLEEIAPEDMMELTLQDRPVGSGPCRSVSGTPENQLVLEANPDYQLGTPGFDRLVITVIDKSNLLTSLAAGDLDYYAFGGNVSVEDAKVAQAAGLEVLRGAIPSSLYELMLSSETIPGVAVHRAIDLALDKKVLHSHTAQGLGGPVASDLTPGTRYDSDLTWARNVDGTKVLLTEGGYDERIYTLAYIASRSGLAALMQWELVEAGIVVTTETVDSAALFTGTADGRYDMAIASHIPGTLPLWLTESRFTTGNNLSHVAELVLYTQATTAIKGATKHGEQQAWVEELQTLLVEERPPISPWLGRTLHVQPPTADGVDYLSSAFFNENVRD